MINLFVKHYAPRWQQDLEEGLILEGYVYLKHGNKVLIATHALLVVSNNSYLTVHSPTFNCPLFFHNRQLKVKELTIKGELLDSPG